MVPDWNHAYSSASEGPGRGKESVIPDWNHAPSSASEGPGREKESVIPDWNHAFFVSEGPRLREVPCSLPRPGEGKDSSSVMQIPPNQRYALTYPNLSALCYCSFREPSSTRFDSTVVLCHSTFCTGAPSSLTRSIDSTRINRWLVPDSVLPRSKYETGLDRFKMACAISMTPNLRAPCFRFRVL